MADPTPQEAIRELVAFSRAVADVSDPVELASLLADAAQAHTGAAVCAVFTTTADGSPQVSALRGASERDLRPVDLLDAGAGAVALAGLTRLSKTQTWMLLSSGGLFGAMVLGFEDGVGELQGLLAEGLAEIASVALDRGFRSAELLASIAELRASRDQLARTESLRRLGQLAAVVAHEVKNPLASIGGVVQVFRRRFPEGSSDEQILGRVLERLGELNQMVDELLQFARPRQIRRVPVPLGRFLREAIEVFERTPDLGVRAELDCADDITVPIDPGMLQRVIHNLLLNAAQAMEGQGIVWLSCCRSDTAVEVRVADRGPGVPEAIRDQLFDPFVTTKVRGTGLGLAVARQVVEAHSGTIALEDPPGGGSCFVLRLPLG